MVAAGETIVLVPPRRRVEGAGYRICAAVLPKGARHFVPGWGKTAAPSRLPTTAVSLGRSTAARGAQRQKHAEGAGKRTSADAQTTEPRGALE